MKLSLYLNYVDLIEEHDPGKAEIAALWTWQRAGGSIIGPITSQTHRGIAADDRIQFDQMICPPIEAEWVQWSVSVNEVDSDRLVSILETVRGGLKGAPAAKQFLQAATGVPFGVIDLAVGFGAKIAGIWARADQLCLASGFIHDGIEPGKFEVEGPANGPSANVGLEIRQVLTRG